MDVIVNTNEDASVYLVHCLHVHKPTKRILQNYLLNQSYAANLLLLNINSTRMPIQQDQLTQYSLTWLSS